MSETKDLNYWKNNAEEDYMKVPISVLRYITELEKKVQSEAKEIVVSEELFEKAELSFQSWWLDDGSNDKELKQQFFQVVKDIALSLHPVSSVPLSDEDRNHLWLMYERMKNVNGENSNFYYMIKFKSIIESLSSPSPVTEEACCENPKADKYYPYVCSECLNKLKNNSHSSEPTPIEVSQLSGERKESELLQKFVAYVFKHYDHTKKGGIGFRHRGDFERTTKPVKLESIIPEFLSEYYKLPPIKENKWISVEERLPKLNERVWVWYQDRCCTESRLTYVHEETVKTEHGFELQRTLHWTLGNDTPHEYNGKPHVSFWQPLPSAPIKEEKE